MQIAGYADRNAIDEVHLAFANFVFKEGLPLRITKSKYLREFVRKLEQLPAGAWKPPAYNTLRTSLLQKAKQDIIIKLRPWDERTQETGVTITCDGWSDAQKHPLLNVLAVNAAGAKFLHAVNTEGKQKTAEYIAEVLIEAIEEVGADNVVQVRSAAFHMCMVATCYRGLFLCQIRKYLHVQAMQSSIGSAVLRVIC